MGWERGWDKAERRIVESKDDIGESSGRGRAENDLLLGLWQESLMYALPVSALFVAAGTFWLLSAGTFVPRRQNEKWHFETKECRGNLEEEKMWEKRVARVGEKISSPNEECRLMEGCTCR